MTSILMQNNIQEKRKTNLLERYKFIYYYNSFKFTELGLHILNREHSSQVNFIVDFNIKLFWYHYCKIYWT